MMLRYFGWLLLIALLASCSRPVANFTHSAADQPAPHRIEFSNASEKATAYRWNFGDGTISEEENPTHRYYESGTYEVVLEAMDGKKKRTKTKTVEIKAPQQCLVRIETPFGEMIVRLSDATPLHRDNFLKLAEEGFYDGLQFHRVINGFMIQGGDPNSRDAEPGTRLGAGGPGYTVPAEFVDSLAHVKGALAAARLGDGANPQKASSGSQFYIVQGRPVNENNLDRTAAMKNIRYEKSIRDAYLENGGTPFLDQEYTVFGQVIEGMDVIDKIAKVPTLPGDMPEEPVTMKISVIK